MALYLNEQQVAQLLTMHEAIGAVEEAFRMYGDGQAVNNPRSRIRLRQGMLHLMAAALPPWGVMGFKAYTTFRRATRFLFLLYSAESGDLLAIIEADKLGQMRTGATTGLATKIMARADARRVGLFGAGWQAQSQLEAVCAVRPIEQVKVFSRHADRCQAFCHQMTERLQVDVRPATRPDEVLDGADIIVTATTSRQPVFDGQKLSAGVHINAIGSNSLIRCEIDGQTVSRSDIIVVDSRDQAKREAGDLLPLIERGRLNWEQVYELREVVVGRVPGRRRSEDITLFKSLGLALEDVAVGKVVYEKAIAQQVGEDVLS
ncbi:MAG: ornithine cyclodeaminase family protein [Acidobacteria bacterium]|nr:MAG: ornithine cyclodeaminase family protein [Acidobacteriota bacterium]